MTYPAQNFIPLGIINEPLCQVNTRAIQAAVAYTCTLVDVR